MKIKAKQEDNKFAIVAQDFATQDRVYKAGERVSASDPIVKANPAWFRDEGIPDSAISNFFSGMPAPPEHRPAFVDASPLKDIPPWRQVRSQVNVTTPVPYAKGSEGERLAREGRALPAAFARTSLAIGQVCDLLSDVVKSHPDWFRFEARQVTAEDIERAEKLAKLEEVEHGEAAA